MLKAVLAHSNQQSPVVRLCSEEIPHPKLGEIRVRWLFAPINPADLNVIEGKYANTKKPPFVLGGEGVGEILESEIPHPCLPAGTLIIALTRLGSWANQSNVSVADIWPIPYHLSKRVALEQWAQLRVNPLTALQLLENYVSLHQEDTILVNAANSAVGQSLIQLASNLGIQVAAFARKGAHYTCLDETHLNTTLFFTDDKEGHAQAASVLANRSIPLACNCVGGESALRQLQLLSPKGTQVTYGAMSKQPSRIPAGLLIFKQLKLEGLWISQWLEETPRSQVNCQLYKLAEIMATGNLQLPIDSIFPLAELPQAIERAYEPHRNGKVLLKLSETERP